MTVTKQRLLRPQGADEIWRSRLPAAIDRKKGHLAAPPLKFLADFQHGGVLYGGGDDVAALGWAWTTPKIAALLLSVAQEVNRILLRIGQPEMPGDFPPGRSDGRGGLLRGFVQRAGIEIALGKQRRHGRKNFRATCVVALLSA